MTSALEFVAGVPEMKQQMEDKTPLGRVGEAEDIAAAALYLSSRAGQYVTGKMLEVDGGIQEPNLDLNLPDLGARRWSVQDHPGAPVDQLPDRVEVAGSGRGVGPIRCHLHRPRRLARLRRALERPRVPGRSRTASTGSRCRCRWTG